jgi:hypothetical protein
LQPNSTAASSSRGRSRGDHPRHGRLLRPAFAHGAAAKTGGVLRVGIAGGGPTDNFDAALINGRLRPRAARFYETPTWLDGKSAAQLADRRDRPTRPLPNGR